ncbi:MAG: 3-methyladenine DNA glycosylase Tag, partial [Mariniflexile sp.]
MFLYHFTDKSIRYLSPYFNSLWLSSSVVEKKWRSFEEVFWKFNIEKLIMMPDDMLERKATDPAIIR